MKKKVFWRSWSHLEAPIELEKIKNLDLKNTWIDAHKHYQQITLDDVWLGTNGIDCIPDVGFNQFSWFAESYIYNKDGYDYFPHDNRFDLRFHFNPNFCEYSNTKQLNIFTWWEKELSLFKETVKNKKPEFNFGMVLAKKPEVRLGNVPSCYLGWYRSEIVNKSLKRNFKYYGVGWSKDDPNYLGECYINGDKTNPEKFHDARIFMTKSKFVWSVENTHDLFYSENYLTEKIFHAFLSASVPIYVGCCNIEKLIDPSLFIDVRKFNYDVTKILDYCEKMPESEYQGYLSRIGDFLNGKGKEFTGEATFKKLDSMIFDA